MLDEIFGRNSVSFKGRKFRKCEGDGKNAESWRTEQSKQYLYFLLSHFVKNPKRRNSLILPETKL